MILAMSRSTNGRLFLFIVAVVSVLVVAFIVDRTRSGPPRNIRIAAGPRGGLYYETAEAIADKLRAQSGAKVSVIATNGDLDNRRLLQTHQADIGLLQVSSDDVTGLVAVTPLYDEAVQIIVRRGRSIKSITDLNGRHVVLGPPGSGTRSDAERILQTYKVKPAADDARALAGRLPPGTTGRAYVDLETDRNLDAAFVTSGVLNPDVQRVMSTGRYSLLEIPNPEAFVVRYPFYKIGTVPTGLYASKPDIPAANVRVLTVRCYLATQENASDAVVEASLKAIYAGNIRHQIPVLVSQGEAQAWLDEPVHPAAQHFFDPYSNLGIVSNELQALSSLKELIAALLTIIYVSYRLYVNRKQAAKSRESHRQKEHLDTLIESAIRLDKEQSICSDISTLELYLVEALELKNTALHDLTDETLRGNQVFTVYILQITGLIGSIENKILRLTGSLALR